MRFLLIVCLLLIGSLRPLFSYAQTEPSPAGPTPVLAVTRQDTVWAIHHLFEARRRTGKHLLVAGLVTVPVALAVTFVQVLSYIGGGSTKSDNIGNVGSALINIGLFGGVAPGLFLRIKSRRAKEKAVIEAYEQRHVLSAKMRQKLVTKYF